MTSGGGDGLYQAYLRARGGANSPDLTFVFSFVPLRYYVTYLSEEVAVWFFDGSLFVEKQRLLHFGHLCPDLIR